MNIIKMCKKSGVSGLIIVDLPHPENKSFAKKCKKNKITFVGIFLSILIAKPKRITEKTIPTSTKKIHK